MNIIRHAALLAASAALAFSMPAMAQSDWPMTEGDWVEIGMISVKDGHNLDYANWLASKWKANQDFAKSKGWIDSYEVMYNAYPREGEPDIYLITRFKQFATPAESDAREKAYLDFMKTSTAELQSQSGNRAEYRTQMGAMLLRSAPFRK